MAICELVKTRRKTSRNEPEMTQNQSKMFQNDPETPWNNWETVCKEGETLENNPKWPKTTLIRNKGRHLDFSLESGILNFWPMEYGKFQKLRVICGLNSDVRFTTFLTFLHIPVHIWVRQTPPSSVSIGFSSNEFNLSSYIVIMGPNDSHHNVKF